MISKKLRGIIIIVVVMFSILFVTTINAMFFNKDNQEEKKESNNTEQVVATTTIASTTTATTTQATTTATTTAPTTTTALTTTPPVSTTVAEATTSKESIQKGTSLLNLHTLKGSVKKLCDKEANVTDNTGEIHKNTYKFKCGYSKQEATFILNGKYNKMELKNIALADQSKNYKYNSTVEFYGDGELVESINYTVGKYPIDKIELNVESVKELTVKTYSNASFDIFILIDSLTLY